MLHNVIYPEVARSLCYFFSVTRVIVDGFLLVCSAKRKSSPFFFLTASAVSSRRIKNIHSLPYPDFFSQVFQRFYIAVIYLYIITVLSRVILPIQFLQTLDFQTGIFYSRLDALMPQKLLHISDVRSVLE